MDKTIANIYGIIVDSFYDDSWFEQEINNGSITPSSRFIFQVASATGDLEVHVNSFGGDVFAANSMIIALRAWAASHPASKLDIIVESIALSAAANFIAMAPKSARVHAYGPSLVMFHSCSTITWGGPGAHKDAASLMDKINGSVKSALKAKTSLADADIDVWFQDERQGWLTAEEAKDCKLIDDILDGEPQPAPAKPTEKLEDKAVAAFYSGQQSLLALHINQQGDMTMPTAEDENKNKDEEEKKENPEQQGSDDEEEKKDPEQEGDDEEEKKDDDPEQKASARVEQLEKEVADLKAQLQAAQKTVAKLTAGFRGKTTAAGGQTPVSFADKVKALKAAKPSDWDAEFFALKKSDPTGYAEFMKTVH